MIGMAVLALGVAIGVLQVVYGIGALREGRLEGTRTPVPGERAFHLTGEKHNVLFEIPGEVTNDEAIHVPPDLRLRLVPAGGGSALRLDRYGGRFTIEAGGRSAVAIYTVKPRRAGRYRLQTRSPDAVRGSTVVLGRSIGHAVARLVAGAALIVLCGLGGLGLLIYMLVRKDPRGGPPRTPGSPTQAGPTLHGGGPDPFGR